MWPVTLATITMQPISDDIKSLRRCRQVRTGSTQRLEEIFNPFWGAIRTWQQWREHFMSSEMGYMFTNGTIHTWQQRQSGA